MTTSHADPGACAIALTALHKRFQGDVAVHRVDLDIADGEFFSLIGPSGCGKTTTLRMIAGLESPTSGSVSVFGRDLTNVPTHKRPVNTVFQNYALFPHLTVFENVAFGLRERREGKADISRKVGEMLELVQLTGRTKAKPAQLSGGQQQRVALARALVLHPEVLLLDEPLGALDLKLRREMQLLLKRVQREVGITFVYVTHDQEEAFSMSTRVGVMRGGLLEQVAPPAEVYRRPRTEFVADFSGASNMIPVRVEGKAGPDRYSLRHTDGTILSAAGPSDVTIGDDMCMVVRPDAITLSAGTSDGTGFDGHVIDASYTGPHTTYTVETTAFGVLKAALPCDAPQIVSGSAVCVSWRPESVWLVFRNSAQAVQPGPAADGESSDATPAANRPETFVSANHGGFPTEVRAK